MWAVYDLIECLECGHKWTVTIEVPDTLKPPEKIECCNCGLMVGWRSVDPENDFVIRKYNRKEI